MTLAIALTALAATGVLWWLVLSGEILRRRNLPWVKRVLAEQDVALGELFDKVNMILARFRKREQREEAEEEAVAATGLVLPANVQHLRKMELRQKLGRETATKRARRNVGQPTNGEGAGPG